MQSKRTAVPVVRVLVVDDDEDTVHTIADFLRMHGMEVATATSGQRALHMAEQMRPQVGFIDLGMNDISGYIVAMRLRRTRWGEAMALAAVSGWCAPQDKRRALMAGFDAHLSKPAHAHELLAFVTQRASRGARQEVQVFKVACNV